MDYSFDFNRSAHELIVSIDSEQFLFGEFLGAWLLDHQAQAQSLLAEIEKRQHFFYSEWQFRADQFILIFDEDEVEIHGCRVTVLDDDEGDSHVEDEPCGIGLQDFCLLLRDALQFIHTI